MASSSSSVAAYSKKYDAFLSFRGSDVRRGFLSHLHKALLDQKIDVFIDDQLERGKEISESLLKNLEQSHVAIVIFSQNYAYSEWCLEELLKIAECRNTTGQIVIPVFYGVDPSHVQDLTGSYGDAMAQLKTKFDGSLVEKWGFALKDTASLSGLVSSSFNTESKLIEEIIKHSLEKLDCLYPSDSDCDSGLVGIESRVKEVMSLLRGSEDVRVVGIWGEGGIGKTTLAKATFDRIRSQSDCQCFVENVREKSDKFTAHAILKEVVSELLGTSDCKMSRKRLSRKKVILVLDDVSDLDQINPIVRFIVDVSCRSRIIVTSRDCHLLKYLGAKIYAVKKLDQHDARQLFCLNAFKKKVPQEGYLELSNRAAKYAQGLPLALEVLGRNLFQRSAEEWLDEFEKLKGASDQKIHKILRISYEGLCDEEKGIFLDIACCFNGRMRHQVERLLDARGSKIGISRLAEKALISISSENYIQMHDLIQQMAKDIICEKAPRKRRWLWDPEEIRFLLTREMGTEAVKGIYLDISKTGNINLSPTAFQKLYNLRYLHFYSRIGVSPQLYAPQGLEYLPEGLRYLRWDSYPYKSLPILSEKLVELDISNSQLEELWNGVQNLPSLKKLDLSRSKKLIKVPDLSTATNLEELCLGYCESLVEIPSSLKNLSKLAKLHLYSCSGLESLPDDICHLKSLHTLDVSHCGNLHGLPQNFGNLISLEDLFAHESGIKELPDSICNLKACIMLDVSACPNLHQLPQNIGDLQSLEFLFADVSGMKEIPSSINKLRKLRELTLGMRGIPSSINNSKGVILPPLTRSFPHLRSVTLTNLGISKFPIFICSATNLEELDLSGNHFESIPESIKHLLKLSALDPSNCKELKKGRRRCLPYGCHPGCEVPEKMTYKNERGSSVSSSFKLLKDVLIHELEFYSCFFSDRPIPWLEYEVIFKNESILRSSFHSGVYGGSGLRHVTIKWDHRSLKSAEFGREFLVKGREYAVEFQFLVCPDLVRFHFSSEVITKCGVFPLFDHQTVE